MAVPFTAERVRTLLGAVVALSVSACTPQATTTPLPSAPIVMAPPGMGCANAIVKMQGPTASSIRTFHGPVSFPGMCRLTLFSTSGTRESVSIAGMFATGNMLDAVGLASAVLPVLQGKINSVSFKGYGSAGTFDEVFSLLSRDPIIIAGRSYPAKQYVLYERDSTGTLSSSQIATFVDNPNDPLSPLYVAAVSTPEIAKYPQTAIAAVEITFLPNPPPQ